jgi:S-adenosylmethionine decarboxylase
MDLSIGRISEYHLAVADQEVWRLDDMGYIYSAIKRLAGVIGMVPIEDPVIYRIKLDKNKKDTNEDDGGITAMMAITTSHINIHTWPLQHKGRVVIDSCKPFDTEAAETFLSARFAARVIRRDNNYQAWL